MSSIMDYNWEFLNSKNNRQAQPHIHFVYPGLAWSPDPSQLFSLKGGGAWRQANPGSTKGHLFMLNSVNTIRLMDLQLAIPSTIHVSISSDVPLSFVLSVVNALLL